MALFRMRRSVKCLLKMLLAAVCYAVLVVGILTGKLALLICMCV